MPHARYVIATALALSLGASPAFAGVAVRAVPSAAHAHVRAITLVTPRASTPGDVLIAIVSARTAKRAALRAPSGWRLTGRTRSGRGSRALTQAVFVHVVRRGDRRRITFRSRLRTKLGVHILATRGADVHTPIGALVAMPVARRGVLNAPALAKASAGDLLVLEYGSTARHSSSATSDKIVAQLVKRRTRRTRSHPARRSRSSCIGAVTRRPGHTPVQVRPRPRPP